MNIPQRLVEFLKQNDVPFEILEHQEAFTALELTALEHVKGRNHAKVVIVKAVNELMMCVVPTARLIDLAKVETLCGKPATLANENEFKGLFPDCDVGTMPPFGTLYGVPALLDQSLRGADFIVFEAGTHRHAMKISRDDFVRVAAGRWGDLVIS